MTSSNLDIGKLKELLAADAQEQDDIRYYSGTPSAYAPKREELNDWLRSNAQSLILMAERVKPLEAVARAVDEVANGGADTIAFLLELNRIAKLARNALRTQGSQNG